MSPEIISQFRSAEEMRAIRLVRKAVEEGWLLSLYPEDDLSDPLHIRTRDVEAVIEDLFACDCMTLKLSKRLSSGNGRREVGATFFLVYQGAYDPDGPISDHTDNDIGKRFFNIAYGLPLD